MSAAPNDNNNYPYYDKHVETWGQFGKLAKWTLILVGLLLVGMASWLTGDHQTLR
jgi:hypothetical protein